MESTALGDEVRRQRNTLCWTLEQLAEEVGISSQTLGRIENHRCKPRTETWLKLQRWLLKCGLHEDYLAQLRPPSLGWIAQKAKLDRHYLARYKRIFDLKTLKSMEAQYDDTLDQSL